MKIKDINLDNRPRERLIKYGPDKLSNEELIAILLRTGNKNKGAIELAYEIINTVGDLNKLVNMSFHEMIKINGIGSSKACSLLAGFEITKRALSSNLNDKRYDDASLVAKLIGPLISMATTEFLYVVFLNSDAKLISYKKMGNGSFNYCAFPQGAILREALKCGAVGIILCHNHPSGNIMPSKSDIESTDKIKEACKTIGIMLLDHIIIGNNRYYSFNEKGLL